MRIIGERIKDKNILKLIITGLKAKVFDKHMKYYEPEVGTPQGGILSPLLSNIYLNKFDQYMEELMAEYNTVGSKPKRNPVIEKLYKSQEKSEIYKTRVPYLHPKDTGHIRVKYIRYADDFVIAINGSRELACTIKSRITE
jgi:retron-type reverse transcriptase